MKVVGRLIIGAVCVYLALLLLIYVSQRSMIFIPATERVSPEDAGLAGVDEITLTNREGFRLYSWFGKSRNGRPTLLFMHGNGGSVVYRRHKLAAFMSRGYGVFLLGYPGYGGSEGSPSEERLVEASALAYGYLRESGIDPENIVLYGESLGSSLAVQLAARQPVGAVVLEAPMSSALELAQSMFPVFPVELLMRDPFLSINHIEAVHEPLLILHGTRDQVIPIPEGRKLYARANQPKRFEEFAGAGHNNLYAFGAIEVVFAFLEGIYP